MTTPADEIPEFTAKLNNTFSAINQRSGLADTLRPVYSDDFITPNGVPENNNYFNRLNSIAFSNNVGSLTDINPLGNFGNVIGNNNIFGSLGNFGNLTSLNPFASFSNFNPVTNYQSIIQSSLANCSFPSLPAANLPSINDIKNLFSLNIFDFALKKISFLPKLGSFINPNIVGLLTNLVGSNLNSILGPVGGYLSNISNCIKKF